MEPFVQNMDKPNEGNTSSMEIKEVVNLLENTIQIIGQMKCCVPLWTKTEFSSTKISIVLKKQTACYEITRRTFRTTLICLETTFTLPCIQDVKSKNARRRYINGHRQVYEQELKTLSTSLFVRDPLWWIEKVKGVELLTRHRQRRHYKQIDYVTGKHTDSSRTDVKSSKG